MVNIVIFFFQAEDGIRDAQESRGLGDVYKRQVWAKADGARAAQAASAIQEVIDCSLI